MSDFLGAGVPNHYLGRKNATEAILKRSRGIREEVAMGALSRRKGASAERELFGLLSDLLGTALQRNLAQSRGGGADGLDYPGWAIEVKRCEQLRIDEWWSQTERQARDTGRRPVLFYRQSRKPWMAVLDAHDIAPDIFPTCGELVTVRLEAAAQVMRELGDE